VSIKPVAIIIEAAVMVHFMKTKTRRVPSEVATAMNPATKMPTITSTMIEIDWVSIMIPLMTHKNDNIVVDMAVSPQTKILPLMI